MTQDPFDLIGETYYWNFYLPKSENGPIVSIVLKNKTTGETFKRPVWRSKEEGKYPYLGKAEAPQAAQQAAPRFSEDDENIPF